MWVFLSTEGRTQNINTMNRISKRIPGMPEESTLKQCYLTSLLISKLYWVSGKWKQDRQCTYNVTLRRDRATIVVVEKQEVLRILNVCFCSLTYPARYAHAPYCHLWPVRFYNIFPHYLTNGTIFENMLLSLKWCFDFLFNVCLKRFMILKITERDMIINVHISVFV